MSLIARLLIGDNDTGRYTQEYLVEECSYRFMRPYHYLYPEADARCETVKLTLPAPGVKNLNLYEWYIGQGVLSGCIVFDLSCQFNDDGEIKKVLKFEDAQCFFLSESYDVNRTSRRQLKLEFVSRQIIVDDVAFNHLNP
ncbi:MAG: hypothetical protein LBR26_04290 [Prevotella sp.]|jgi:hypothetical protein|nr:hypothetical protein [Prevotella sp.]